MIHSKLSENGKYIVLSEELLKGPGGQREGQS